MELNESQCLNVALEYHICINIEMNMMIWKFKHFLD